MSNRRGPCSFFSVNFMLADACCRQSLQLTLAQSPYGFEEDHFARLLEYSIYIYIYVRRTEGRDVRTH